MVNKVDVIFTGLLRETGLLMKSIRDLNLLKDKNLVDKIIFSTWYGELEKNEDMKRFFSENKVVVVESEEPKERGHGSIWCQMLALEKGLNSLEKNNFVLKTRTDVYIKTEFLEKLFNRQKKFDIVNDLPKGNVFEKKIWVVWFELTRPFYMADECFFGKRDDLKKLVNYDKSFDTVHKVGPGLAHIRRFIHPFLKQYPILESSLGKHNPHSPLRIKLTNFSSKYFDLRKITPLRKLNEARRFKSLKNKLKNQEYLDCLAAYYSILHSHFYVDGNSFPKQITFQEASSPSVEIDLKIIDNNFDKRKERLKYGGQIYVYSTELINNLFENKLVKTKLSERLKERIERFNEKQRY